MSNFPSQLTSPFCRAGTIPPPRGEARRLMSAVTRIVQTSTVTIPVDDDFRSFILPPSRIQISRATVRRLQGGMETFPKNLWRFYGLRARASGVVMQADHAPPVQSPQDIHECLKFGSGDRIQRTKDGVAAIPAYQGVIQGVVRQAAVLFQGLRKLQHGSF